MRVGGGALVAVGDDPEGAGREVDRVDGLEPDLGAEAPGLLAHLFDQLGPEDAVREAGVVLDLGGDGELAAGLRAFEHDRRQVGAGGVERGGQPGRAGAENGETVVRGDGIPGARHAGDGLLVRVRHASRSRADDSKATITTAPTRRFQHGAATRLQSQATHPRRDRKMAKKTAKPDRTKSTKGRSLASARLIATLNRQIGNEMHASMQYVSIAAHFAAQDLHQPGRLLLPPGRGGARARDEVRALRGRRRRPGRDPGDRRAARRLRAGCRGGGAVARLGAHRDRADLRPGRHRQGGPQLHRAALSRLVRHRAARGDHHHGCRCSRWSSAPARRTCSSSRTT